MPEPVAFTAEISAREAGAPDRMVTCKLEQQLSNGEPSMLTNGKPTSREPNGEPVVRTLANLSTHEHLRVEVAQRMLRDELGRRRDFDTAWADEADIWLANADSALATVAEMLRAGGEYIRGMWCPWDTEQRGYARGFADRISPEVAA